MNTRSCERTITSILPCKPAQPRTQLAGLHEGAASMESGLGHRLEVVRSFMMTLHSCCAPCQSEPILVCVVCRGAASHTWGMICGQGAGLTQRRDCS